jgi:poly(A) polymerase
MRGKLEALAAIAKKEKTPVYIVGGFVRDGLLGKVSRDVDLAVAYEAGQFAKQVSWLLRGDYELLESQAQYSRVILTCSAGLPFYLDFSLMRGKKIADDLCQRDFTVNAMAILLDDYLSGPDWPDKVIDPCGGKSDVSKGLLRLVSAKCLRQDPVRLLRAARFLYKLGFSFAPETKDMIKENAHLVRSANKIKVSLEIFQILSQNYAPDALRVLQEELGVLGELYGPLAEMCEAQVGGETLFEHGLMACRCLDEILHGASGMDPGLQRKIWTHLKMDIGGFHQRVNYLRLACVLHDIGKLGLRTGREVQSNRKFSHELAANQHLCHIGRRLRLSEAEICYIDRLIGNHSRPLMLLGENGTMPAKLRFFRQFGDLAPDLIMLAMANAAARQGCRADCVRALEAVLVEYFDGVYAQLPEPFLHAQDIMEFFNLPPTRSVGGLMEHVYAAQCAGTVKNKQGALSFVSALLDQCEHVKV